MCSPDFLVGGLLCNLAIKPLSQKWFMSDADVAALQSATVSTSHDAGGAAAMAVPGLSATTLLAWLAVEIPILLGIWVTLKSTLVLFG